MRQRSCSRTSIVLLPLIVLAVMVAAQTPAQDPVPAAGSNSAIPSAKIAAVSIKIAAGDLIEVSVFDSPELTQTVRVGSDGKVQLALVGGMAVGGLTAPEASEKIAIALREGRLLLHPHVNVLIKEFATQGVSVSGEVAKPGVYPILGPRTLLDVISMAGGLTNYADTNITVKHRSGDEQKTVIRLANNDAGTSVANDVQIFPGDLVVVPRAGIVYVLGDVNRPGGFVMQDSGKISLLQALAQAGGATGTADMNGAMLLRKTSAGYTTEKLEMGKIARGQIPDIELASNDVLFVPNKKVKTFLRNAQGVIGAISSASIYAVVH